MQQAADFFRAVGEATHNGVFMLAHEPLVQLLVPSLGAMIDKVPQARAPHRRRRRSARRRHSRPQTPRRPRNGWPSTSATSAAASKSRASRSNGGVGSRARIPDKTRRHREGGRFVQSSLIAIAARRCSADGRAVRAICRHAAAPAARPTHPVSRSTTCTPSTTSSTPPSRPRVDTSPSSCAARPTTSSWSWTCRPTSKKMITYTQPARMASASRSYVHMSTVYWKTDDRLLFRVAVAPDEGLDC